MGTVPLTHCDRGTVPLTHPSCDMTKRLQPRDCSLFYVSLEQVPFHITLPSSGRPSVSLVIIYEEIYVIILYSYLSYSRILPRLFIYCLNAFWLFSERVDFLLKLSLQIQCGLRSPQFPCDI